MGSGGDLDVKALLQRLQPAQRHAEPRIGLAGRDRLQQLVRRAAVIDQFDVEIVLLENAVIDRNRQRREADRAGVPGQFQFPRRACERRRIGSGPADRKFREVDRRVAARNGKACAPNTPTGAANAAATPARNKVRRSSNDSSSLLHLQTFSFSCISGRHSAAVARNAYAAAGIYRDWRSVNSVQSRRTSSSRSVEFMLR